MKIFYIISILIIAIICYSEENSKSIMKHKNFLNFKKVLIKLTKTKVKVKKHHFFISRYQKKDEYAFLFWREGSSLIMFTLDTEGEERWEWNILKAKSGYLIKLPEYIARTQTDLYGTYMTDKAWASDKIYNCLVEGDMIIIDFITKKMTIIPSIYGEGKKKYLGTEYLQKKKNFHQNLGME